FAREPSPPTPLPLERGVRSPRLPPGEDGGDSLLPRGEGAGRSPSDEGVASKPSPRSSREPSSPAPLPIGRSEGRPSLDGLWDRGARSRLNVFPKAARL